MVGMMYHFGKQGRNVESLTNRGCFSGGSCGGDKKVGIVTFGTTWQQRNMGNYLRRAPQRQQGILFALRNTTRNPVQQRRATFGVIRGLM
jgi:hypothetical protein